MGCDPAATVGSTEPAGSSSKADGWSEPGTPPLPGSPCDEGPFFDEAAGLRRWPYLQNVTSDSARVMFTTTRQDGEGVVRYWRKGSAARSSTASGVHFDRRETEDLEDYEQYDIGLENLEPDTDYCYEIYVDSERVAGGLWLHTGWTDPTRAFDLLVLGDSGTGSYEWQYPLRDRIITEDADALIHVGDLGYDYQEDPKIKPATYVALERLFFQAYAQLLHRMPVYPALGNHEEYADEATPYLSMFSFPPSTQGSDAGRYYSFDLGNMHVVSLDSNPELLGKGGRRRDMLQWLEEDLEDSDHDWLVFFFHHPPFLTHDKEKKQGDQLVRERLVPLLQEYDVDFVLMGHDHRYERTKKLWLDEDGELRVDEERGISYIVTGAGGREPKGKYTGSPAWFSEVVNDDVNSYVRIHVDGCLATFEVVATDGDLIDDFELQGC